MLTFKVLRCNSEVSPYNKKDLRLSMPLGFDRKVIWLLLAPFPTNHSAHCSLREAQWANRTLEVRVSLVIKHFQPFEAQIECTLNSITRTPIIQSMLYWATHSFNQSAYSSHTRPTKHTDTFAQKVPQITPQLKAFLDHYMQCNS